MHNKLHFESRNVHESQGKPDLWQGDSLPDSAYSSPRKTWEIHRPHSYSKHLSLILPFWSLFAPQVKREMFLWLGQAWMVWAKRFPQNSSHLGIAAYEKNQAFTSMTTWCLILEPCPIHLAGGGEQSRRCAKVSRVGTGLPIPRSHCAGLLPSPVASRPFSADGDSWRASGFHSRNFVLDGKEWLTHTGT